MTHRPNCAAFVDALFGAGSATFDVAKTDSKDLVGALVHPKQFANFKAGFAERLRRIKALNPPVGQPTSSPGPILAPASRATHPE
jgi:hypothetical protein